MATDLFNPISNITPSQLNGAQSGSAPAYAIRAWVNFNGTGTVAINGSGNVSSITDRGVGLYTVNFTTSLPDTSYFVVGCVESSGGNNIVCQQSAGGGIAPNGTQKSVSSCQIITAGQAGLTDFASVSVAFLR